MKISVASARVNAEMTQEATAKALGISKSTYINYEKGRTQPTLEIAEKIAELFKMKLDQIRFKK